MKKLFIILFSLLLSYPAFSAEYGHLGGYYDKEEFSLLSNVIKNKEISYCTYAGKRGTDEETLSLFFKAAFNRWTLGVAYYIQKAGREKEFSPLIFLLTRPITLTYLGQCDPDKAKADIAIVSDVKECRNRHSNSYLGFFAANFDQYLNSKAMICITEEFSDNSARARVSATKHINLFKISKKRYQKVQDYIQNLADGYATEEPKDLIFNEIFRTMTHEVGHAMGLSDEYGDRKVASTIKKGSNSPYRGDGIMNDNYLMTGDDVNGIIVKVYSLRGDKISFDLFDDTSGTVVDNEFRIPTYDLSNRDSRRLKKNLRISKQEYDRMMKRYSKNYDLQYN